MVAEYIERDKLQEALQRKKPSVANRRYTEGWNDCLMRVKSMVHAIPAADVESISYSFWEEYETSSFGGYKDEEPVWWKRKFFRCERCRKGSAIRSKYCPNCGCIMDKGE